MPDAARSIALMGGIALGLAGAFSLAKRRRRRPEPEPTSGARVDLRTPSDSEDCDDPQLAERMAYHCTKGLCCREECAAFLEQVCAMSEVESIVQEDLVLQFLAPSCDDEAVQRVCAKIKAEAERLYGCRMVLATDWAVKSLGFHTTYHQDEFAYCTDRSSYTAWILLDRTALARSAGLDIISYDANRRFYNDVFRRFSSRCLLVRDTVFSYFAPPSPPPPPLQATLSRLTALVQEARVAFLSWRFTRLRYLAHAPTEWIRQRLSELQMLTPTASADQPHASYAGGLVVDRLDSLDVGDFVIFNSGLFHSSSNPSAREVSAYKFYYKMHMVRADATLGEAPIDDYGASSFASLRVGDTIGSWEPPPREMIVREYRPTSFSRVCAIKGTKERSVLPEAQIRHL